MNEFIRPQHPGFALKEDFLDDLEIKPGTLAKAIGVDRAAIKRITDGKRDISAEMSMRLGRYFGINADFWFRMQNQYDMRLAQYEKAEDVDAEVTPLERADAA